MKLKTSAILCLVMMFDLALWGSVKPTKNIIVMIPDGTSLSVLSASRWLKTYKQEGNFLAIDPYLTGTVTTFSSNAPIGDSAPTTSCYMTGMAQQAGNIAIYPVADPGNDLVPVNPDSAYQPLTTLLEAMKLTQNKSTGLVFTCEFTHATPADCSAHAPSRKDYATIASQMVYNNLDVVIGGGNKFLSDSQANYLQQTGTEVIRNNKDAMLAYNGEKLWALFHDQDIPFDIDRDTTISPSLAQMTQKSIELLQKNKKGFFLMVEGSKVDWAAHANDPIAIMTEFLAFDRAVKVVMDFAKKDKNTTVIILPDHGNSGFAIGKSGMKKGYTTMTINDLYQTVANYKYTSSRIEDELLAVEPFQMKSKFKELTGIELNQMQEENFLKSRDIKASNYMEVNKGETLSHYITLYMNENSNFAFTSTGHTGEEVFLAAYHPNGNVPRGNVKNKEINTYLVQAAGLKKPLKQITSEIYVRHTDVFEGTEFSIEKLKNSAPKLIVKKGNNTLTITANTSIAILNGQPYPLHSLAVYIDKTNLFYVPAKLKTIFFSQK